MKYFWRDKGVVLIIAFSLVMIIGNIERPPELCEYLFTYFIYLIPGLIILACVCKFSDREYNPKWTMLKGIVFALVDFITVFVISYVAGYYIAANLLSLSLVAVLAQRSFQYRHFLWRTPFEHESEVYASTHKGQCLCPYCGKQIQSDTRFCMYCGAVLKDG
jgi:hypothetical protein